MAKKSTSKAARAAAGTRADKSSESSQLKEKYPEAIATLVYDFDENDFTRAEPLYKSPNMPLMLSWSTIVPMVLILAMLILGYSNVPLAAVIFLASVLLARASSNWGRIRRWLLARTNLAAGAKTDPERRVAVLADELILEGPGDEELHVRRSDIRRTRKNDYGILVEASGKRVVWFPADAMSKAEFEQLTNELGAE